MVRISYNMLCKLLIDMNVNKSQQEAKIGLENGNEVKLGNCGTVGLKKMEKICYTLKYNINDAVEFAYEK